MRHPITAVMVASAKGYTSYTIQMASGRIVTKRFPPRHSLRLKHYDRISRLANTDHYRMRANIAWPGFSLMRKTTP